LRSNPKIVLRQREYYRVAPVVKRNGREEGKMQETGKIISIELKDEEVQDAVGLLIRDKGC